MSSWKLGYFERLTIERYLENYPELKELYQAKGYERESLALTAICGAWATHPSRKSKP